MKHSLVVMAAFLGLSLLGCGGPVSEPTSEPEAQPESGEETTVSQFATCTALCAGGQSVSCSTSGTPCSSMNYQGVTCNGVYTPCPGTSACTGYSTCSSLAGKGCSPEGAVQTCCYSGYTQSVTCVPNPTSPLPRRIWVWN